MLTSEVLEEHIRAGDPPSIVEALADLPEGKRRALKRPLTDLRSRIHAEHPSWEERRDDPKRGEAHDLRSECCDLAMHGIGGVRDISELWGLHLVDRRLIARVLADRDPHWLQGWGEKQLTSGQFTGDRWWIIHELIELGAIERPSSEDYVMGMVPALGSSWGHVDGACTYEGPGIVEKLLPYPNLIRDIVPRLFEIETTAFHASWIEKGFSPDSKHTWFGAFCELVARGDIAREFVLRESLAACLRGLDPRSVIGLFPLHEAMKPTRDERTASLDRYLELVGQHIPKVPEQVLRTLKTMDADGLLTPAAFASALPAVLRLPTKGTARRALSLVKRMTPGVDGAERETLALATAAGLMHASADVQEIVLDRLGALMEGSADAAIVREAIAAKIEFVAPSLRGRVERLAGASVSSATDSAAARIDTSAWDERLESIAPPWRDVAGVQAARAAFEAEALPPSISFDPMAVPRLEPADRLVPIESATDLAQRLLAYAEGDGDAEEGELLLDGISRHADSPLTATERALFEAVVARTADEIRIPASHVVWCARRWFLREDRRADPSISASTRAGGGERPLAFWIRRGRQMVDRAMDGPALPMLSCPTHRGGWLDPRDLVGRLRTWMDAGLGPERWDLIQALLRLAPDHRADALASVEGFPDPAHAAVRFALGGPPPLEQPTARRQGLLGRLRGALGRPGRPALDGPLWIAAARARSPELDPPPFIQALACDLPGAAHADGYRWSMWRQVSSCGAFGWPRLTIEQPGTLDVRRVGNDLPTVLARNHLQKVDLWDLERTALGVRLLASMFPQQHAAFFMEGARMILERLDESASPSHPAYAYLVPLLEADVAFSKMAALALALGVSARDADVRGVAVDALIATMEDGRLEVDAVADALEGAHAAGAAKPGRVATAVAEAGRVSLLHQALGARLIEGFVARLPQPLPRDTHHLLAAWHELAVASAAPPANAVRERLMAISGKTKTARLARKIAAIQADPTRARAVAALAVEGRLMRAERWQERAPAPTH